MCLVGGGCYARNKRSSEPTHGDVSFPVLSVNAMLLLFLLQHYIVIVVIVVIVVIILIIYSVHLSVQNMVTCMRTQKLFLHP